MDNLVRRSCEIDDLDLCSLNNPPETLQPVYSWVWNAPIDRAGIRTQLDAMHAAGIRGTYILPEPREFRPNSMRTYMEPPYLSAEFFQLVRYAIEYAFELGMSVWMYDEGGWPSGGASGQVVAHNPALCRKRLNRRNITIAADTRYTPGELAIAAFTDAPISARLVSPNELFSSAVTLTEYYQEWLHGNNTDPLDSELGAAFVAGTHQLYSKYLSDLFDGRLPMMFTDEPGAGVLPWPRGFAETFQSRYGYDITPYIPAIVAESDDVDEPSTQARIDYRELTGELFRSNYFVPIHDWCRANNVLSTGHLDLDHLTDGCIGQSYGAVLPLLRELDLPGIDVIWRQIAAPGGLWIGAGQGKANKPDMACSEGNGFFPRFAASAASQIGRKLAMSESFAIYGAGTTGNELLFTLNFQLVRGINLFNFMSASYGKQGALAVVARPGLVSEMPGYSHLRGINDYVARACYLMQLGTPGADTALYFPARDMWSGGSSRLHAQAEFERLGQLLEARHVDFDIVDDAAIRQATLRNEPQNDAVLKLGLAQYKHVLIPAQSNMPADVFAKLAQLDGNIVPVLECVHADAADAPNPLEYLRMRKRDKVAGGQLFMLFNESNAPLSANVQLPPTRFVYKFELSTGWAMDCASLPALSNSALYIELLSGEAAFLLCTDTVLAGAVLPLSVERAWELAHFSIAKTRETTLDSAGIHVRTFAPQFAPCELGCWHAYLGEAFSGEAIYRAHVQLDTAPVPGEKYAIELNNVECSARVLIAGVPVGCNPALTAPWRIYLDGAELPAQPSFDIDIEVANTLANQCVAADPGKLYAAAELGGYSARELEFEKRAPRGGLYGPVLLIKLV